MVSIIMIKITIEGPKIKILFINNSHSLASAPKTIIIKRNVEILVAMGSNKFAKNPYFNFTKRPIPTGIAVIKNMVKPRDKILNGGASAPIKKFIDIPVIIGRVITDKILITAV